MKKIVFSLVALALVFASCEKEPVDNTSEQAVADDLNATEIIINEDASIEDALETSDYEVDYFTGSQANLSATMEDAAETQLKHGDHHKRHRLRYVLSQAPDVSIDSTDGGYPIIITLDYGDGTELENGKTLKGQIIITLTAPIREENAQRIVEFNEFFVDSMGVEGISTNTYNFGGDGTAVFQYDRRLKLNFYNGSSVSRQETKTRAWMSGLDTPYDLNDDEIQITGTTITTGIEGVEYQREITDPLIKIGPCKAIVQGVIEFSIDGELKMVLDYGDGECDNLATIRKDGEERIIRIGRWWHR